MSIRLRGRGTGTFFWFNKGESAAVSAADEARIRYNTTAHRAEISEDGAAYVPFGAGAGASFTVADIAELAAEPDAPLADGCVASMLSLMCLWQLNKSSAAIADGITVIATASGVGRWYRLPGGARQWQLQPTWYINNGTGDDENDGYTALTALATWDEFARRHGGELGCGGGVKVTVNVDGPAGIFAGNINIDMFVAFNETLLIRGTRTVLYSGSVTAYQAWNSAIRDEVQITDAAIPVSWTASGLVDQQIVMTNGAHIGAASFIVVDLGAKVCRSHFFVDSAAGYGGFEPIVTSTFDVCTCTQVAVVNVNTGTSCGLVQLEDLFVTTIYSSDSRLYVVNSKCNNVYQYGGVVTFFGGMVSGVVEAGAMSFSHSITKNRTTLALVGGQVTVDNPCLRQTNSAYYFYPGSVGVFNSSTAFFDCNIYSLYLHPSSYVKAAFLLWGTGNIAAYAIVIDADGCFSCETIGGGGSATPDILGSTTAAANLGGVASTFAELTAGKVNATNLARAVQRL